MSPPLQRVTGAVPPPYRIPGSRSPRQDMRKPPGSRADGILSRWIAFLRAAIEDQRKVAQASRSLPTAEEGEPYARRHAFGSAPPITRSEPAAPPLAYPRQPRCVPHGFQRPLCRLPLCWCPLMDSRPGGL
ncbi:hypothetical protein SKAU_G00313260 [Synaphobranchus kaupii]|uniref:Uncharacterized protein n=1 Tax=Synaphobranchus kaupii TaxID=118154 RepID=A0A9Q1ES72_SYNKA|nr:hypothetical protein SKAU_G00313260 [Synaphobranchus kaupii]